MSSPTTDSTADVVVVGSGSGGAATARRLLDAGMTAIVLESGGPDTNEAIHTPARVHELWFGPEDWAYHTVPQEHAAGRRLHWPRGRVFGGSSALNGMIHVRGARQDFDAWAYAGNDGWRFEDVLPFFRAMEDYDRGADELHGTGGPIHLDTTWEPTELHRAFERAAAEIGIPRTDDCNGERQEGFSYIQSTVVDVRRRSTTAAYLAPVRGHPSLTVLLRAHALRLLFDGGRCVGVEYEQDGERRHAIARHEVVVAAGAIESPRLLMLSGIGPAGHLREHGIEVAVDLRGVGENLHDHVLSPVIFAADREIALPPPERWAAESHLFWHSRPGLPVPDLQPIHFSVPAYESWMEGPPNGFTLLGGLVRPASRGRIRLRSADPAGELEIDPRVLSVEADVAALQAAVELCRRMGATAALAEWGARELYPGPGVTTQDALRDYLRRTVVSYHHQVGTCRMGIDAGAVVDPRLRVHGTDGLRVADASVMPAVTTGNTNAATTMIGERAAAFIVADAA